jgi:hypothetical protein
VAATWELIGGGKMEVEDDAELRVVEETIRAASA